jgi:hypothetical protein
MDDLGIGAGALAFILWVMPLQRTTLDTVAKYHGRQFDRSGFFGDPACR